MTGSQITEGRKERSFRMGPIATLAFLSVLLLSVSALNVSGQSEDDDSEHDYHNNEWTFLIISFVMTYGASAIVAGLFAMKFGQRKSKIIGGIMTSSGIVPWGFWIIFKFILKASYPDDTLLNLIHWSTAPILKPLMAVIGVILGGGLALFIFLSVVVRS